jgi:hypothetical protein
MILTVLRFSALTNSSQSYHRSLVKAEQSGFPRPHGSVCMGDIFRVNCPGCGEEKGSITTHPGTVGIHCSYGVTSTVDVEAKGIGEWWDR